MGRHKSWAESTTGPDMLDLEMAMRAVGEITLGVVSLTVLPQGTGATGGLRVVLTWCANIDVVNGPDDLIVNDSVWPCREGCTFQGHVLGGIAKLDHELWLRQSAGTLPKA